ncbi:MAG: hypothetical protein R3F20_00345 [Planctomycetota bacterium]
MKSFWTHLAAAAAATLVVHRGSWDELVSGADRARAAGFRPAWPEGGFARAPEMDVSRLLYGLESALFGGRHALWMVFGMVLLALVGASWGYAVRRLSHDVKPGDRSLPLSAGLATSILVPASAIQSDAVTQLPGHAGLLGLLAFALATAAAARRPTFLRLVVVPALGGLLFRETVGLGFYVLPLVVCLARPAAALAFMDRRGALGLGVLILLIPAVVDIVLGHPSGARDVGDASGGFGGRWLASALWLLVPAARPEGFATPGFPVWAASFLGPIAALAIWGHLGARPGARRVVIAVATLAAWGLSVAAIAPAPTATGGDVRILGLAALGLAAFLGLAVDAAARRGPAEIVVLALLAFLVYSGGNAASDLRARRAAECFPPEWQAVRPEIDRAIANGARNLAIHGLAADAGRVDWASGLAGAELPPFGPGRARIRAWAEDELGAIDPALLVPGDPPLSVLEWWPRSLAVAARRPQGWGLAAVFRSPGGDPAASPIRLVAPENEARITLRRPETIEEDMTFVFETIPGYELPPQSAFAFYSLYSGGLNPRGRGEIRARPIVASSLVAERLPSGAMRYRWRPSIRPEEGHDGVRFEDPDLGVANRPFLWTIGVVRLGGEASPEIPSGHSGHLHDRAAIGVHAPVELAQTRRIRFSSLESSSDG